MIRVGEHRKWRGLEAERTEGEDSIRWTRIKEERIRDGEDVK